MSWIAQLVTSFLKLPLFRKFIKVETFKHIAYKTLVQVISIVNTCLNTLVKSYMFISEKDNSRNQIMLKHNICIQLLLSLEIKHKPGLLNKTVYKRIKSSFVFKISLSRGGARLNAPNVENEYFP